MYTLHYFGVYARGEPIRMLLTHAGVPFNDDRITMEGWGAVKHTMPNGQCPALETPEGKVLSQSSAIVRYLGRKYGYYPTDLELAYEVDNLNELYQDVLPKLYTPVFAQGDDAKAAAIETCFKTLEPFLVHIESVLKDSGYLVGENLNTCDFWIGGLYTNLFKNQLRFTPEKWDALLAKFPKYAAYGERFSAANASWISSPARGMAPC